MAETGDDSSIWRWLIDERDFVVTLLRGSQAMAEEVLEDALDARVLQWRCQRLAIKTDMLDPAVAAGVVGVRGVFWRRQSDTTINVDYPNHCAVRIGPPWFFRRGLPIATKAPGGDIDIEEMDFLYNLGPVFLPGGPSIKLIAKLIKLHHGDVVRRCRYLGLLPPASPPSQTLPEPIEEAQAPLSAPAPEEAVEERTPGRPPGERPQYELALQVLRALYTDGKAPRGAPIKKIRGAIAGYMSTNDSHRGLKTPSSDIVAEAVEALGRTDEPPLP
jgi:hypothetical protein